MGIYSLKRFAQELYQVKGLLLEHVFVPIVWRDPAEGVVEELWCDEGKVARALFRSNVISQPGPAGWASLFF